MVNTAALHRVELRESLVAAATRIVAARGYQALKARELAAEVGCAVGSIYNAFPDIDALFLSVKARALDMLESDVVEELGPFVAAGPEAAAARFLKLGRVYLDFAARHWRLWSSVFEHRGSDSEALAAYMGRLDAILTNIEQPLSALLPHIEPAARRGLARTLFAAVHGVVSLGLDGKLGAIGLEELHEQVRSLLAATLRGLQEEFALNNTE
jgi:AcrR family transcriptional regulator